MAWLQGAWKRFHYQFGDYPEVICTKVRDGDKRIVRLKEGTARGRHVVIVDDLVQSGALFSLLLFIRLYWLLWHGAGRHVMTVGGLVQSVVLVGAAAAGRAKAEAGREAADAECLECWMPNAGRPPEQRV